MISYALSFGELSAIRSKTIFCKPYLHLDERTSNSPVRCVGTGGCWGNDPVDGLPRPPKKDKDKSRSTSKNWLHKNKKKRSTKIAVCDLIEDEEASSIGNKYADAKVTAKDRCARKANDDADVKRTTDAKAKGEMCATAAACKKNSFDLKTDVCYTQSADSVYDQKSSDSKLNVCNQKSDDSKLDICYTQSADCVCDKSTADSKTKSSIVKCADATEGGKDACATRAAVLDKSTADYKVESSITKCDESKAGEKNACLVKAAVWVKVPEKVKTIAKKEMDCDNNMQQCSSCPVIIPKPEKEKPTEIPSPLLFKRLREGELGPGISKTGTYQNPEYFSYTKWSFYDAMIGIAGVMCPQPSNKTKPQQNQKPESDHGRE